MAFSSHPLCLPSLFIFWEKGQGLLDYLQVAFICSSVTWVLFYEGRRGHAFWFCPWHFFYHKLTLLSVSSKKSPYPCARLPFSTSSLMTSKDIMLKGESKYGPFPLSSYLGREQLKRILLSHSQIYSTLDVRWNASFCDINILRSALWCWFFNYYYYRLWEVIYFWVALLCYVCHDKLCSAGTVTAGTWRQGASQLR